MFVPVLLGLGLLSLSVSPNFVPFIKYLIRKLSVEECRMLVNDLMKMVDTGPIFQRLKSFYESKR